MTDRESLIKHLKYCSKYDADCMKCERWDYDCGDSRCVENLLEKAAVALEQQRWIPVNERLPEGHGKYLCVLKSGAFRGCYYQMIMYHDQHGFRDGCVYYDDVTHWMPLPEPPKEEE